MSTASSEPNTLPPYDAAACRVLMRGGSKTFFAASMLLPARVRAPACALYAFCRLADDEIDDGDDPAAAVQQLHGRLDAIYDGRPQPIDVDRALASLFGREPPELVGRVDAEILDGATAAALRAALHGCGPMTSSGTMSSTIICWAMIRQRSIYCSGMPTRPTCRRH